MNTDVLRNFLRSVFKKLEDSSSKNGDAPNLDDRHPKVLPPFGGELGHEVRSFLGRVEPWLRSGWKILAKRPELYPPGSAFYDPEYFDREAALLKKYQCIRLGIGYHFPPQSYQSLEPTSAEVAILFQSEAIALKSLGKQLKISIQELRDLMLEAKFERELRRLFSPYLLHRDRPITYWDHALLSVTNFLSYAHLSDFVDVVVPGYLPGDYLQPVGICDPHIGVQLRARSDWSPDRNSNPQRVLTLAKQAAQHLHLPILVYGHPNGSLLPEGYTHTADPGVDGLLKRELGCLTQCQLMFAPDSGWADLMAWLKVPTLIEQEVVSHAFQWLEPFHPRLNVIQPDIEITQQVDQVRSQPESLPIPNSSGVNVATPDRLIALKQNFIRF